MTLVESSQAATSGESYARGMTAASEAWRTYFEGSAMLAAALERRLKDACGLDLADFNILLLLSEADGGGDARLEDLAIELRRGRDWDVTKLFVRRTVAGGLRWRRGETLLVDADSVTGLTEQRPGQGASVLLATLEGLKPADVADVLHDLPDQRRLEVASELNDERLADVLAGLRAGRHREVEVGDHGAVAVAQGDPLDAEGVVVGHSEPPARLVRTSR